MLNEQKPTETIDFSSLGGRLISRPMVSENPSKSIDLADLGGKSLDGHVASEPPKADTIG